MDITVYHSYESIMAECPWCHDIQENNIEQIEYVSRPMLWCWKCCAHAWLNCANDEIGLYKNSVMTPYDIGVLSTKTKYINQYTKKVIPLMFIISTVPNNFSTLTASQKLSNVQLKKLNNFISGKKKKYGNGVQCYKFEDISISEWEYCDENWIHNIEHISSMFNMSFPVASYNLTDPSVPYPNYVDLAHDGVSVYALLENGEYAWMSGD